MTHVEIMKDVPDAKVAQLVADYKAEGALSVSVIPQGGGLSTIMTTWADAPLSESAKTVVALGATAQPASAEPALDTMKTIATRLGCDVATVRAIAAVESSGTFFWDIGGVKKPPVRLEAHHFGKLTGYQYSAAHPQISCKDWTPSLAAKTRSGAYDQFNEARALDETAAMKACSWGAFQIMGFHSDKLSYGTVQEMFGAMQTESGQIDAFVRFIEINPAMVTALKAHDWLGFATRYNGTGNAEQYSSKLESAWLSFK